MQEADKTKQVITIRVSPRVVRWLKKEAADGRTTVSRLANWYLEKVAKKSA
jgi:hypothetical protein